MAKPFGQYDATQNDALQIFLSQMRAEFDAHGELDIPACAPYVKALAEAGDLCSYVIDEIKRGAADSRHEYPKSDSTKLFLEVNEMYSLAMDILARKSTAIYSHPFDAVILNTSANSIAYSRYRLPDDWDADVYKPDTRLRPVASDFIKPGEYISIRGSVDVYDLQPDSRATVLKLFSENKSDLEWAFDRETLIARGVSSSNALASRQLYIIRTLSHLREKKSIDTLCAIADSPTYFIRWAAIQAIAKLSPERAIPLLRAAANDPHPEIRQAALLSLNVLNVQ